MGVLAEDVQHVRGIIWDDFIPFNWESRIRLREAPSGKTGPNHSMDVGSFHLHVWVNAPACWSGRIRNSSQIFDYEAKNISYDHNLIRRIEIFKCRVHICG